MPIPTFVSAGTIATDVSGGASTTPTPPAHVADDILIAVVHNAAPSATSTATSGWNSLRSINAGAQQWWWKRATGAGTAGPTITAGSTDQFAIVYVFRNCITGVSPIDWSNANNSTSTTPTINSAGITGGTNRLAVGSAAINNSVAFSSGYPPTNWDGASNLSSATGTTCRFALITRNMPTSADPGSPVIGTLGSSQLWAVASFALIGAPDPFTPPQRQLQPYLAQ